jgi:hypothetical protein
MIASLFVKNSFSKSKIKPMKKLLIAVMLLATVACKKETVAPETQSNGNLKNYQFVFSTNGGVLTDITAATDANGQSILRATGWSYVVQSSQITINHPLGNSIVAAHSQGVSGSQVVTKSFFGSSPSTYSMVQNSNFTQINFYAITASNAGFAVSGASTYTINLQATK